MLLGLAASAFLGPVLAFAVGYVVFPVPTPDDVVNNQVALLSYADGDPLTRLVPEQGNRTKVPIQAVPEHVREAVLAAEDRSFYSNPGFDPIGIARAAWNQIRGGDGGGSTITQQYVKNTLVGDAPSLWRKYKELIVSVKVSQEHTKDQILGDYLNAIYFGRGAYGIQAASQAYFGKNVQDLTVAEGAVLAGVIQSPSRWDPAVNPDRAVARWKFVLDGMVAQGWLTPATARRRNASRPPSPAPRNAAACPRAPTGTSSRRSIAELADLGITEQDVAPARACASPRRSTRPGNGRPSTPSTTRSRVSPPTCAARSSRSTPRPAASWPTTAARTASASTTRGSSGSRAPRSSRSPCSQAFKRARRSGSAPRSRASRCPACATTRARAARTAT